MTPIIGDIQAKIAHNKTTVAKAVDAVKDLDCELVALTKRIEVAKADHADKGAALRKFEVDKGPILLAL